MQFICVRRFDQVTMFRLRWVCIFAFLLIQSSHIGVRCREFSFLFEVTLFFSLSHPPPIFTSVSCCSCSPTRPPRRCWERWSLQGTRTDTRRTPVITGAGAHAKVTPSPCGSSTWTWRTAKTVKTML